MENNIGKPNYFDIDKYLDCVEGMITADEVERALWMLANPPAWYRDNEPERLKEIRQSLHEALFTPSQYSAADNDTDNCDPALLAEYFPARAQQLWDLISALNLQDVRPNIMELGPGSFWLPYSLASRGCRFSYEYQSLGGPGYKSEPPTPDAPNILVSFELIEHLHNEMEIYQAYLKFKKKAQYIFISTPAYTWGGGMRDWRGKQLGHLRTFTPKEFSNTVMKMFGDGYDWKCMLSDTICMEGKRK